MLLFPLCSRTTHSHLYPVIPPIKGDEPRQMLYRGVDLLTLSGSTVNQFAISVAREIWTDYELRNYMIKPRNYIRDRPALDMRRWTILKGQVSLLELSYILYLMFPSFTAAVRMKFGTDDYRDLQDAMRSVNQIGHDAKKDAAGGDSYILYNYIFV